MAIGIGRFTGPMGGRLAFGVLSAGTAAMAFAAFSPLWQVRFRSGRLLAVRGHVVVFHFAVRGHVVVLHLAPLPAVRGNVVVVGLFFWLASFVLRRLYERVVFVPGQALVLAGELAGAAWIGFALSSAAVKGVDEVATGLLCWAVAFALPLSAEHPIRTLEDLPAPRSVLAVLWSLPAIAMVVFAALAVTSTRLVRVPGIHVFPAENASLALALFALAVGAAAGHVRVHVEWMRRVEARYIVPTDLLSGTAALVSCALLGLTVVGYRIAGVRELQVGLLALGVSWMLARIEAPKSKPYPPPQMLPEGTLVRALVPPPAPPWASAFAFYKTGGVFRPVADALSWYALGGPTKGALAYPLQSLDPLRTKVPIRATFEEGAVLRGERRATYVIAGGEKYLLQRMRELRRLGGHRWQIQRISDAALAAIPNGTEP